MQVEVVKCLPLHSNGIELITKYSKLQIKSSSQLTIISRSHPGLLYPRLHHNNSKMHASQPLRSPKSMQDLSPWWRSKFQRLNRNSRAHHCATSKLLGSEPWLIRGPQINWRSNSKIILKETFLIQDIEWS